MTLSQDVARLNREMADMQQELRNQSQQTALIVQELQHQRDMERVECEKLILQLQNEVLKMERRLPPGPER